MMPGGLKKKVGPLPVWAWGAAIGLGILLYYIRNSSSGPSVGGAATANPVLDPTQGSFPMPSGISSGGMVPDMPTSLTSQDIADAVSAQLVPVLTTLPQASVPGQPSNPLDDMGAVIGVIQMAKDAGLIQSVPAASTGAAASKPQAHTAPKHVSERVNRQTNNPRKGQTYKTIRVAKATKTRKAGTYHVYGTGKTANWVRVKK